MEFIHGVLEELQEKLVQSGSSLEVFHDTLENVFEELLNKYRIEKVFNYHDNEPYSRERDNNIKDIPFSKKVEFIIFKVQVIFEKDKVIKDDGAPYTGHFSISFPDSILYPEKYFYFS